MNQKGLVLEMKDSYAVVLTPDGRFCRIPRTVVMEVGNQVTFDALAPLQPSGATFLRPWISRGRAIRRRAKTLPFGAAAAVVLVTAGIWVYGGMRSAVTAEAYAWVSVDVNPSVSLQVDQKMNVKLAKGTDNDGRSILKSLHLDGMALPQATEAIMSYASDHNMLAQGGAVLISVSPIHAGTDTTRVSSKAEEGIETAVQKIAQSADQKPAVYAVDVPPSVWQAADEANVSPGRLMSVLVAAEEGHPTGLLDAQGSELSSVWANPEAKSALDNIQHKTPEGIAKVLQSLAEQGYIGTGATALQTSASGSAAAHSQGDGFGQGQGLGLGLDSGKGNQQGQGSDSGQGSNFKQGGNPGRGSGKGNGFGNSSVNNFENGLGSGNGQADFANGVASNSLGATNAAISGMFQNVFGSGAKNVLGPSHIGAQVKTKGYANDNENQPAAKSGNGLSSSGNAGTPKNNPAGPHNRSGPESNHSEPGDNKEGAGMKDGISSAQHSQSPEGTLPSGNTEGSITIKVGDQTFTIPLKAPQTFGDHGGTSDSKDTMNQSQDGWHSDGDGH